VRAATAEPFGVNVFVPGTPYPDAGRLARYLDSLGPALGDASWDDDGFDGKIAALLAAPPAVTSFTFGCPASAVIRALQDAGSAVVVTDDRHPASPGIRSGAVKLRGTGEREARQ
jgi:nitronate monooxygenase